ELLGEADVAHHAGEAGNQLRRLDPPDRVDGTMGIGSRHGCRYTIWTCSTQAGAPEPQVRTTLPRVRLRTSGSKRGPGISDLLGRVLINPAHSTSAFPPTTAQKRTLWKV